MFDTATAGIRQWVAGLFAAAMKQTQRPEDRHGRGITGAVPYADDDHLVGRRLVEDEIRIGRRAHTSKAPIRDLAAEARIAHDCRQQPYMHAPRATGKA